MRFGLFALFLLVLCLPSVSESQHLDFEKEQNSNDSVYIERGMARADSLVQAGEVLQSIQLLRQLSKKTDSLSNASLVQKVNIQLAENYLEGNRYASAEKLLDSMLVRYPDSDNRAQQLCLLGNTYRYQGRYKEAIKKLEQAIALVDSARQPGKYGMIVHARGSVHGATGNYGTALKYYLQSIEIAEAMGDSLALATGLNSLGVAYNNNSNPAKAKYYLQRAIEINKKINYRVGLLRGVNNLAISFEKMEMFDRAIEMYKRALELHHDIRDEIPPFRVLYNLGQLHRKKNDLDKAEMYYRQSLDYCEQANILQGLAYNYGGLANVAELRGNISKADEYYRKALKVTQELGVAPLEMMALNSLYDLEKRRGNYEQALSYYERFSAVSDSMREVARQEQMENTKIKLDLRKQGEINQLLQDKQKQQEARITVQNWLIISGMVIIIVILISLYLLYRSNKDRKRINTKLELQRNQLEELNRVKDRMMAIIAHDLRSPMASMQGVFHLLREGDMSPDEVKETATELEVSLQHNLNMMDNLLSWTQSQMSGLELDLEVLQAHGIVDEVFSNYSFQANHKSVQLLNDVEEDLKVKADANLLKLIVRNLISNAIKFSNEEDTVTVSAAEEGRKIYFRVKDTGIGIPSEKQETLFLMNGVSRNGTKNEQGSGLGLLLCKEFVEKQGGEIAVESTEGVGTTFIFSLPKAS